MAFLVFSERTRESKTTFSSSSSSSVIIAHSVSLCYFNTLHLIESLMKMKPFPSLGDFFWKLARRALILFAETILPVLMLIPIFSRICSSLHWVLYRSLSVGQFSLTRFITFSSHPPSFPHDGSIRLASLKHHSIIIIWAMAAREWAALKLETILFQQSSWRHFFSF